MFGTKKWYWWWILIVAAILLILMGIFVFGRGKQTESLERLIIQPTQEHSATVIFLHGLGNNAARQKTEIEPIAKNHPHIKFIFPQAPTIPISMNWGVRMPAWYNITTLFK